LPKKAALAEHGIHQGGFAVVDMGDDGDVANVWLVEKGDMVARFVGVFKPDAIIAIRQVQYKVIEAYIFRCTGKCSFNVVKK
jgi:hypothetical protein